MYPIIRFAKVMMFKARAGSLEMLAVHVSDHLCWPWDVDPWMELNNGRTLTLYDLGRMPLISRLGMMKVMKQNGWGMAVAGASVRYRRRVTMFQRLQMRSHLLGWDDRFFYFQQSMLHKGEAASSILVRSAITANGRLHSPSHLARAMGWPDASPPLPQYATDWINADAKRPWPPLD